jgi:DNA (cytosine-5)-methyltransferase 1
MASYYNEFDPEVAQWLRELIADGQIPAGEVDERSIADVHPQDLRDFAQCHFFAGIGGWPLALALAGWPDDQPVWTGSCPCQPFSAAGKGLGHQDERHLWPVFFRLIRAVRPAVVLGEQVAGAAGYAWFDGVADDLEMQGYACRAVDIPALAVGLPHQRQRLYWAAVSDPDGIPPFRAAEPRQEPVPGAGQPAPAFVADGVPSAVVRRCVKGFGNAIVPPLAAEVIRALMESK